VNHADTFCGENKVKRFFSGLVYFLLLGNTEGMVTNYKDIMNGKREIPISSCPSQIEDWVYGTGSVLYPQGEDAPVIELADDHVPEKKGKNAVKSEREVKLRALRKECGYDATFTYCTVDTENRFSYEGKKFVIDSSVEAYAPKSTPHGLLYDMDKIICVKSRDGLVRYYTAKYDPIPENKILEHPYFL